jgi:hypothetical protein
MKLAAMNAHKTSRKDMWWYECRGGIEVWSAAGLVLSIPWRQLREAVQRKEAKP